MGSDRYITWGETPEWGPPTIEKVAATAIDFLGDRWTAKIRADTGCLVVECGDPNTFHLASERPEMKGMYRLRRDSEEVSTRGFEIWFEDDGTTVITTRAHSCDSFTDALVERFTKIIARWWNGEIEWPG